MKLDVEGSRIVIEANDLEKSEVLKTGYAGIRMDGTVSVPLNWMSYSHLISQFRTEESDIMQDWAFEWEEARQLGVRINSGGEAEWDLPDLWDTQQLAIERIMQFGSVGLFDDRGMGKTRIVLEAVRRSQMAGRRSAVVVTSKRLRSQWVADCERWWSSSVICAPEGATWSEAAGQVGDALITVVTYQSLLNEDVVAAIRKLDPYFAVLEEAHNVKKRARTNKKEDSTAKGGIKRTPTLSGAVRNLPGVVRIALTGTPMPNYWYEVWTLLNFVSPKEFSSFWQFVETIGSVRESFWGGKDIDPKIRDKHLWDQLWDRWVIRRERTDRRTVWHFVPVELSPKETKAYRAMQHDMRVEMEGQTLDAKNVLDQATKLQQLAGGYGDWETWGDEQGGMRSRYSISAPSSKTEVLCELLSGMHRAVVFTRFRNRAEYVGRRIEEELGVEVVVISGGQTERQTDEALERFLSGSDPLIAVCVFGTIQEGRNELVAAQDIFFLDWVTVSQVEQAVDRLDRPGQAGAGVRAVTLYSQGTVDELTIDRERGKVIPLRRAIRSREGWAFLVDSDPLAK